MDQCKLCGEKRELEYQTIDGERVCADCFQGEWSYPSSVIRFGPDGQDQIKFTKNFSEEGMIPEPVKEQKWVSTDAWRGYTDWVLRDGFKEVAEGWVTGWVDETIPHKIEIAELFESLKKGDLTPPVDLYFILGRTSNVFSTSCSVVARGEDQDRLNEWLEEVNGGIEGVQESLR